MRRYLPVARSAAPSFRSCFATMLVTVVALVAVSPLGAQAHDHASMMGGGSAPTRSAGQAAFAAISEIVAQLSADSTTDWSKIDLEVLRQHLIDMDELMIRARVVAEPIPDGVRLQVRGTGRTIEAIHRILEAHAPELDRLPAYRASTSRTPTGETLTVTARTAGDQQTAMKIRALGFPGLLTEGSHHGEHHMMMVRVTVGISGHSNH